MSICLYPYVGLLWISEGAMASSMLEVTNCFPGPIEFQLLRQSTVKVKLRGRQQTLRHDLYERSPDK